MDLSSLAPRRNDRLQAFGCAHSPRLTRVIGRRVVLSAFVLVLTALFPCASRAQIPNVTVASSVQNVPESGTTANAFTFTRSIVTAAPLTVTIRVNGNASPGGDFVPLPLEITIPGKQPSVSIPLTVLSDTLAELDEAVFIDLHTGPGYNALNNPNPATQAIFITDDDLRIRIIRVDTVAAEPGQKKGIVVIDRFGSLSKSLNYQLSLTGTAVNNTDYNPIPIARTLAPNQRTDTIFVVPRGDNLVEPTESVTIGLAGFSSGLSSTSGLDVSQAGAVTVTIADARATVAAGFSSVTEIQGSTANFVLTRTGDLTGSASVTYALSGGATNGTDYNAVPSPGTISFAAGSATANLPIVVKGDNVQEGLETIVLTLNSSTTLGLGSPNSATIVIDESGATVVSALTLATASVTGSGPVSGTVTLNGPAPVGGRAITFASTLSSVTVPSSFSVPAGQSSASFTLTTAPVASNASGTVSATAPAGNAITAPLTVLAPVLTALTLNKATVTPQSASDATSVSGTVTISGPAPAAGATVQLSSSSASVVSVPTSVTVPANQTSANVTMTVVPVAANASVTITATRSGSVAQPLIVNAPVVASFTFSPASLVGRTDQTATSTGTFVLSGTVPQQGLSLGLTSNNTRLTLASAALFLQGGLTSGTIVAHALPVATPTPISVTTDRGGAGGVTITPPAPASLTLNATSVVGGSGVSGRVALNGQSPTGGISVPVSSSSGAAFPCNAQGGAITALTFTADSLGQSLSVCSVPVATPTPVTINAGVSPSLVSAPLQVLSTTVLVSSMTLSATEFVGGQNQGSQGAFVNGTVTLAEPAPSSGLQVTVTSSQAAMQFRTVQNQPFVSGPLNLFFTAGTLTRGLQINAPSVANDVVATLNATPGNVPASITVRAPSVVSVAFGPGSVAGGGSTTGQVNLNAPAPQSGISVQLSSSNASVSVPPSVIVVSGGGSASFQATAAPTQVDTGATITATRGSSQKTVHLIVAGPLTASSLSLSPSQVPAGTSATGTVTLSAPAPSSGASVTITSNKPQVTVPSTVSIPSGQSSASFPISTAGASVTTSLSATISATMGGQSKVATLVVTPIDIASLSLSPAVLEGGATTTGTLVINSAAPSAGVTISLSASSSLASVPATVTVPAGSSSVTFTVATSPTATTTALNVTAALGQSSVFGQLTVSPPTVSSLSVSPSSVTGGTSVTGTVTLSGPAANNFQVPLTSSAAAAAVPTFVNFVANQTSATFAIATTSVASSASVTISAGASPNAQTKTLTVNP